jgi:hypothetical protein
MNAQRRLPGLFRIGCSALLAIVLLAAAPLGAEQQWTYASSPHFEVYTTGGPKRARAALAYFERVHAFFADVMDLAPKQQTPTRLIVFSSEREFKPYRMNDVAIAYYRAGPDRDYIVMQSLDAESYPIVVHEYAHLIIRHSGDLFPLWLNEGLAEFFSTIEPEGGKMTMGKVPRGRLMEVSQSGPLMSMPALFGVNHESREYNTRDHAGLFYGESWALAHMINAHQDYRARAARFLAAVSGGATSADAFQAVYGKSPQQVFSDLETYVHGQFFVYYSMDYRQPAPESSYTPRAADAFEARLVKATLLAEGAETEAPARAALEDLARERPDDLGVLETRGYLELRHHNAEAARPYLARAVALGSRNARLYRDYAGLTTSVDERAALLEKALALDPDDLDVRLTYASQLLNTNHLDQAVATLAAITTVPSDRAFMLFQIRANALIRLNRPDDARSSAALALQYAKPGNEQAYADKLVKSIDEFVAARAAAERASRDAVSRPPAADAPVAADTASTDSSSTGSAAESIQSTGYGDIQATVDGQMTSFDCTGPSPVVVVAAARGGTMRLLVDNPNLIALKGTPGATTTLTCGPQKTKVVVGYLPKVDAARKTVGLVRMLDFSPSPAAPQSR